MALCALLAALLLAFPVQAHAESRYASAVLKGHPAVYYRLDETAKAIEEEAKKHIACIRPLPPRQGSPARAATATSLHRESRDSPRKLVAPFATNMRASVRSRTRFSPVTSVHPHGP
jgi:hypothetical protein